MRLIRKLLTIFWAAASCASLFTASAAFWTARRVLADKAKYDAAHLWSTTDAANKDSHSFLLLSIVAVIAAAIFAWRTFRSRGLQVQEEPAPMTKFTVWFALAMLLALAAGYFVPSIT